MGLFDELNKAKKIIEQQVEQQRREEIIRHEKNMKKIREEYMELSPITNNNILGMRKSTYEMTNIGDTRGKVIEFFLTNGTRCILGDRDYRNRTKAQYYTSPDSIDDVCEALSYIIPRFADGTMKWYNTGYGDLYGLEADRWNDIVFDEKYIKVFVDYNAVNGLSTNLYKKIEIIVDSWSKSGMLQVIGRSAYDGWIDKLKQVSTVVNNNRKAEAEKKAKQRKEALQKEAAEQEERMRKQAAAQEERIRKQEAELAQKAQEEENKRIEAIENAGKKGEAEVDYALKWLDKQYVVLDNGTKKIRIQNTDFIDESQEYDHIIVGPKGIILVETKAYSGEIVIDEAGNWKRKKNGEWIGELNPVQQIRRHEKLIHSFISSDINITSFICIANSGAIIEGSQNSIIPIVKSDLLVERIENLNIENDLTKEKISECITLITSHMI